MRLYPLFLMIWVGWLAACAPTTRDFEPAAQVADGITPTAPPISSPTLDPVSATATAAMAPYITPLSLTPTPWVVEATTAVPPLTCADGLDSHPDDCQALYDFFVATDGPHWQLVYFDRGQKWFTTTAVCAWYGLTCDPANGRVTEMRLSSINLNGFIPPSIGNMSHLKLLHLSHNDLTGPIPAELGQLTHLEMLFLDNNALSGSIPPTLGELPNMLRLALDHNALTGSIPVELSQLSQLERLVLSYNALTGPIPPELADLPKLQHLWLNHNAFSGDLPPELTHLTNLLELSVAGNPSLSGGVPLGLADLPLRTLHFAETAVCAPHDPAFQEWVDRLDSRLVSGLICP